MTEFDARKSHLAVGLELVIAVLFSAFSYDLSERTGNDWFSRSGAVMCLLAAAGAFRLAKLHQDHIAWILKDQHETDHEKFVDILKSPSKLHQGLSFATYGAGLVGTVIWGYGDLLL